METTEPTVSVLVLIVMGIFTVAFVIKVVSFRRTRKKKKPTTTYRIEKWK